MMLGIGGGHRLNKRLGDVAAVDFIDVVHLQRRGKQLQDGILGEVGSHQQKLIDPPLVFGMFVEITL
jgi:hypothetical protein